MLCRTRVIKLGCGIALVFLGMAMVQSLSAQRFRDNRLRLTLPPANDIAAVKNGGSVLGVTPPSPIPANQIGQPMLITGNMGQQGQGGQFGQGGGQFGQGGGQFGLGGSFGSFGQGGSFGSFGQGGSFGSFGQGGSFGSFGGGQIGALGGQLGSFGGGAFGKGGGAFGANGAIGL